MPLVSDGKLELSEKEKGVVFAPPPLEARLGYAEVPFTIEIPVVEVVSVAVAEVASSNPVRNVRIQIDRSWRWKNERHPGADADNPGRSVVYAVPGEIPPGGRLPFTYRPDSALPQRSDGSFETSVSVVGLEQVG